MTAPTIIRPTAPAGVSEGRGFGAVILKSSAHRPNATAAWSPANYSCF
jgi:hypothetical protein